MYEGEFGVASPDKLMFLHLCEYMLLGLYIDILHAMPGILHVGKCMHVYKL